MLSRLSARLRARRNVVLTGLALGIAAAAMPMIPPLPAAASSTPTLLGEQGWYTLDRHQLWDRADLAVNVASGDLIFHQRDLAIAGKAGRNLILERYYNSLSNGVGGGANFGSHWVMTAGNDVKLTIGTSISYQGPGSFQQVFTGTAPSWASPPGMDATLNGPNGSSQYTLTYHDNGQVLTFDSTGLLRSNADRNGNTIAYAYTSGQLSQITDATGRTVSLTPGSSGNITTITDNSLGRTYSYSFDGSHNLTGYVDPAYASGQSVVLGYDTTGKHELIDISDPATATTHGHTHLIYDSNHRVTEIDLTKNTGGGVFKRFYAYNSGTTGSRCDASISPAGNTVITDDNGHKTDFCWDSTGRVIEKVDGDGNRTYTTWSADSKPASVATTDPGGGSRETTQYQYNDPSDPNPLHENLTAVIEPTGATTSYAYGAATNRFAPTQVTEANGNAFTYTFDSNGNPYTMVNGNPNTVTEEHGVGTGGGLLYFTLDAKGTATPGCFNTSWPRTECYSYDANGALSRKIGPSAIAGANITDTYVNDAASRVSIHTDARGQVTTYFYDADDRVTQISYGSANPPHPCTPSLSCTLFTYDADGNLTQMQDQTGTTTFSQDPLNRPATETESGSTPTSYTFDGAGNLTTLANGAGTISYGFDAADRLTSLQVGSQAAVGFAYDAAGSRTATTYPNGVIMTRQYDASERLTSLSSSASTSTYAYTGPGGRDTNLRYTASQTGDTPANWANAFTAMDNLSQSQGTNTAYDANANACGAVCGSGQSMSYSASNALTNWNGITYSYDANGNLASWSAPSGDSGTEQYNVQNQWWVQGHGSSSITYAYRGVGQADRASATGSFGNQAWTSDVLGVSTETNSVASTGCPCYYVRDTSGALVEEILTSGGNAGTYYPVFDGEGSVAALTNSSGGVVDTWTYTPNGQTTQSGGVYEPWQFQGGYMDATAGQMQYHLGQRYYEAGMMNGHWTQLDPVNTPLATRGWNRYAYAGNDTADLTDPNGIDSIWSILTAAVSNAGNDIGATVGGIGGRFACAIAGAPTDEALTLPCLLAIGGGSALGGTLGTIASGVTDPSQFMENAVIDFGLAFGGAKGMDLAGQLGNDIFNAMGGGGAP